MSMNKVELQNIVGGQLQEKFGKSFMKVIENLQDPNTSFKVKRGITIKLDFTQNESRDDVSVSVLVTEKLAPQQDMNTKFYVGKDLKTGELFAEEYGKQVRGQMNLDDFSHEQTVDGKTVDTDTDEIIEDSTDQVQEPEKVTEQETKNESVVDFRKAAQ